MKHYHTRIAFAEKEIKRITHRFSDSLFARKIELIDVDSFIDKLNQANRIRKHYIAKNYEYKRARMKDKL
jgi:hypothetical protein